METLSSGKDLLFTLLLKVGAAASLAALLVRSAIFRKVLFTEVRDSDLKVKADAVSDAGVCPRRDAAHCGRSPIASPT